MTLHGKTWGRARLTVTYDDGTKQTVSYYVIKPEAQAVADLGHFLTTKQWFTDPSDPFHRAPSAITYDRETNTQVTQDSRVWIAGLGDEGGAGSWLAAAMKEFGQPQPDEVAKYEQFVDNVLWGGIQYKDGPNKYGVRKSVFYYDPANVPGFPYDPALNWTSWASWNQTASEDIGRGYNYPHVVAAYWAMYRAGAEPSRPGDQSSLVLVSRSGRPDDEIPVQPECRRQTPRRVCRSRADGRRCLPGASAGPEARGHDGGGGRDRSADEGAGRPLEREAYPFGSEMAWDSTGQEEVYAWCKYFGYTDKAEVSLDSILGYMPTIPHWGYNGNARRYWDFLYGGAPGPTSRIERQFHHYGSGLNAIPVLSEYRDHPDDFYLLRVGYGGTDGRAVQYRPGRLRVRRRSTRSLLRSNGTPIPAITARTSSATPIIRRPMSLITRSSAGRPSAATSQAVGDWVQVQPLDSFRMRVYIAPRGLWLTLDAGAFSRVEVNTRTHAVRVGLAPAAKFTPQAFLRVEQPAKLAGIGIYRLTGKFAVTRDAYTVPLGSGITWVELRDAR